MIRRHPRATRTYTLCPYTTLFRAPATSARPELPRASARAAIRRSSCGRATSSNAPSRASARCVLRSSRSEGVMTRPIRIGQIVPSSNVTMETEIPALLRAREAIAPERFTFHSSRLRMKKVTKEELAALDATSYRCAIELSDAAVDVLGYACLVAIMSMGEGYHRVSEARLQ